MLKLFILFKIVNSFLSFSHRSLGTRQFSYPIYPYRQWIAWLFIFLFPAFLFAEESGSKKDKEPSEISRMEKIQKITIKGKVITYRLIFDCMPVTTDSLSHYGGRMCYNAYLLEDGNHASRPISFFLNGGPGAASVYLNFGVAGPQIIKPQVDERNFIIPDGVVLVDNPHTWLDRSDLVFIDPVGTGFSYVVPEEQGDEQKVLQQFWGVHEDLQSLAHFIRLWITDHNRWTAPKVLVGESYGGLRVGALTKYLLNKTGISPAGVVMVSPALDLWLIREQSSVSLSPWLRFLPSFIHTARHYNLGDLTSLPGSGDLETRIEAYLLKEYLPRIAQGYSLNPQETENFYSTLAQLTGLEYDLIAKNRGQISLTDYAKHLFREQGLVVSLYDSTVSYLDPHPRSWYYGQDIYLSTISAVFHTAANHYYRDELGMNDLREFHTLNNTVNASWKYPGSSSKEVETFSDLEAGLGANPQMQALIVHGRHDLVTPYYTSRYLIIQSQLPQAQERIRLHLYDGGHMFYLNPKSLKQFDEDIRDFYRRILRVDK